MKLIEVIYFGFELNLLEAHLATHQGLADQTIVVECGRTPGGEAKPLLFKDNWGRFEKYDVDYLLLPDEMYQNITKTNAEFIQQERPAKYLMHKNLSALGADWVFHSDTDEILDPQYFPEIRERMHTLPAEVKILHHHLDQRSPFINAFNGVNHVHRAYRASDEMPSPKHVKRASLVNRADGICGWHFTNCFSTPEEVVLEDQF